MEGTGAGVYVQSLRRRLSFPLGKYVTVFQPRVYTILSSGWGIYYSISRLGYILFYLQAGVYTILSSGWGIYYSISRLGYILFYLVMCI
jgi:hypothetical protein